MEILVDVSVELVFSCCIDSEVDKKLAIGGTNNRHYAGEFAYMNLDIGLDATQMYAEIYRELLSLHFFLIFSNKVQGCMCPCTATWKFCDGFRKYTKYSGIRLVDTCATLVYTQLLSRSRRQFEGHVGCGTCIRSMTVGTDKNVRSRPFHGGWLKGLRLTPCFYH